MSAHPHPRLALRSPQQGFAFIAALFLLVVLGAFIAFVITITMNSQTSGALAVQGARAYEASRAGVEWATYQILDPRTTINGVISRPLRPGL